MTAPPLPRRLLLTAALLATLLTAVFATSGSHADTGSPAIGGEVRHGADGTALADVEVVLLTSEEGEQAELARTTTDADGAFRFEPAPTDIEVEVVATYDGAPTRSGPFLSAAECNEDLELVAYDTTADPSDVVISSWVVWVDRDLGVTFQHDLQVDNTGERTWVGFDPDEAGTRTVISVPLHADAFGLGFLGRFTECCSAMRGNEYVHTSPLPPGRTNGTVRYAVETTDRLELTTRLPVASFTLMLPEGVTASGAALERAGDIESQGTAYGVYTAEGWDPGEPLVVGLSGLDVAGTPWWWYAAAGLGGLLVTAGVAWWWRQRSTEATTTAGTSPATAGSSPVPDPTPAPEPATNVATEVAPEVATVTDGASQELNAELLLEELALLDVGRERGLISDEVHHQLRTARTRELRALRTPAGR